VADTSADVGDRGARRRGAAQSTRRYFESAQRSGTSSLQSMLSPHMLLTLVTTTRIIAEYMRSSVSLSSAFNVAPYARERRTQLVVACTRGAIPHPRNLSLDHFSHSRSPIRIHTTNKPMLFNALGYPDPRALTPPPRQPCDPPLQLRDPPLQGSWSLCGCVPQLA